MRRLATLLLCLFLALPAVAEQVKRLGDLQVHYSVYNSSFLQPNVAAAVGVVRSKTQGVVNIVPLDAKGKPVEAVVSGSAKNLLGQEIPLTFKRVVEEGAVYHLAQFPIESRDTLTFSITVKAGKDAPQSFEFLQEIFPDE
ncbi:DUF4426 domain-containing protein [Pseudomonas panipatensis]|jgi:hypothetical protein|uniref:DUF4426 domain-containing protein n=1 Tax=Pseudomonas panipatensis TaxID=428992 RepID=A0A1G8J6N9_9PSED|nr:DUF4426 domain-containing protein [Pseudomonas panipatensis]SDI26925.1 protein of unknown function [Pseudomonas panipatensis]SMP49758.1 protein of unknown function [Pseudomonas panipatensis]